MYGLKVLDIKRVLQVELVRRFMAKWIDLRNTYGTSTLVSLGHATLVRACG
jgi:hypothetical protein